MDYVCDTLAKFRSTVIVTKVFILRPVMVDRGRTTKQISMFPGVRTQIQTRMWANAQRDGRPAEHKWRPLFNAAKFEDAETLIHIKAVRCSQCVVSQL